MKRLWRLILVIVIIINSGGCYSYKENKRATTQYYKVEKFDSIFVRVADTLFVFQRGDTVRVFEKSVVFKDNYRIKRDTMNKCDTIIIKEKTNVSDGRENFSKKKNKIYYFFILIISILLIFAIKICKKFFLKR